MTGYFGHWTKAAILLAGLATGFHQPAMADDLVSVCDRSVSYRLFLEDAFTKYCAQVTAADLETITRVDVEETGLSAFDPHDVANLPNLEILNLNGNPFIGLPPQAFASLPKLKTLVLIRTGLTQLPDDFLAQNPAIENLIMYKNAFTSIPDQVLTRIESLPKLKVLQMTTDLDQAQKDQLTAKFPANGPVQLEFL
jgi:hypothetical protein